MVRRPVALVVRAVLMVVVVMVVSMVSMVSVETSREERLSFALPKVVPIAPVGIG